MIYNEQCTTADASGMINLIYQKTFSGILFGFCRVFYHNSFSGTISRRRWNFVGASFLAPSRS